MAASPLVVRKGATTSRDPEQAVEELYQAIAQPDAALTIFYCSPDYDLAALGAAIARRFGTATPMIGCTTAGEISPLGYREGTLTGVSLAGPGLAVELTFLEDLRNFQFEQGDHAAATALEAIAMRGLTVDGEHTFGFLLVDGLSMQEEGLVSALYRNLGNIQLFGGSAGDGTRFERTFLYHDGKFHSDCAVFALVCSRYPFTVFKTEHFIPSPSKLVVTGADPARRIVTEINGEPAGPEYARLLGLGVDKLTPLIFATHPLVVRAGGEMFVRSIQKVNDDGSLTFFCAIDEGIVLTIAQGIDLVQNLEEAFANVRAQVGEPAIVLGCDCVLRFLETGRDGNRDKIAEIFAANNVIGFSTYGEQFNGMHVNQTFTGVALSAVTE